MVEFVRVRVTRGVNVAEDLRLGRGVRAIICSTSGLADRPPTAPVRADEDADDAAEWCVGKLFLDRIIEPDVDFARRRGGVPPGTGGRALSAVEGVPGWVSARLAGGVRGVLGRRGRGALPKTALVTVGLWGERMSEIAAEQDSAVTGHG